MAYFADLTPYAYGQGMQPSVVHVGWLDDIHVFPRGPVPPRLIATLKKLARNPVELYRGFHICELCSATGRVNDDAFTASADAFGSDELRGSGEVRLSMDGVTFAAPVLIVHYIEAHGYQPPGQFLRAVEARARLDDAIEAQPTWVPVIVGYTGERFLCGPRGGALELRELKGHCGAIMGLQLSADGKRAVSGGTDDTVRLWDLELGALLHTLTGHAGPVNSVALNPSGTRAVSGSLDSTLRLWDLERGTAVLTLEGHSGPVTSVALSADGTHALSGSLDSTLRLWDLERGAAVCTLQSHCGAIYAVALSADGTRALSGGEDGALNLWDLGHTTARSSLQGHSDDVYAVAFSADGTRALSGSLDTTVRLWDLEHTTLIQTVGRHVRAVNAVALSADGTRTLSGSRDQTVKLWQPDTSTLESTFNIEAPVYAAAFAGSRLAATGRHGSIVYVEL